MLTCAAAFAATPRSICEASAALSKTISHSSHGSDRFMCKGTEIGNFDDTFWHAKKKLKKRRKRRRIEGAFIGSRPAHGGAHSRRPLPTAVRTHNAARRLEMVNTTNRSKSNTRNA